MSVLTLKKQMLDLSNHNDINNTLIFHTSNVLQVIFSNDDTFVNVPDYFSFILRGISSFMYNFFVIADMHI
jgi:hypothetical protein